MECVHTKNWFSSYLSNRKQCVSLNGHLSDCVECLKEVLGSLVFIMYINDMPLNIQSPNVHVCAIYADDTCLTFSASVLSIDNVNNALNQAWNDVVNWRNAIKFPLNKYII